MKYFFDVVFIGGADGDLVDEATNGGFNGKGCSIEGCFNALLLTVVMME